MVLVAEEASEEEAAAVAVVDSEDEEAHAEVISNNFHNSLAGAYVHTHFERVEISKPSTLQIYAIREPFMSTSLEFNTKCD